MVAQGQTETEYNERNKHANYKNYFKNLQQLIACRLIVLVFYLSVLFYASK